MTKRAPAIPEAADGEDLARFCRAVLRGVGADRTTAEAATRAMTHASRLGVDSHGVRLLAHYVRALDGGRVAKKPRLKFVRARGAAATLDAGHAHGALAAYRAMDRAMALAARQGIGAIAIANTSHFGAAGAYALAAAARGFVGLAVCNSDAFVRLHDGAARLHGTNPIAFAAPVAGGNPWLLDMATSAIPYNRVQLYRSLARLLPPGVASDSQGRDTRAPELASMLAPLGGAFGFKGAGLAGLVEILSAALTGMRFSPDILPMGGPDMRTPRQMGAFVLAIDPRAFLPGDAFAERMAGYLRALRGSAPAKGRTVMAPGDREWAVAAHRARAGIPLDPLTRAAFARLSKIYGVSPPRPATPDDSSPRKAAHKPEGRGK